jgi:hypothetical protein
MIEIKNQRKFQENKKEEKLSKYLNSNKITQIK